MPIEEQANASAEATDGCRPSLVGTRNNARQWQRVEPDEEANPLAGFDWEKEPTRAWAAAAAYSS